MILKTRQQFFKPILFLFLSILLISCKKEQIQIVEEYTQNKVFFSRTGEISSIGSIKSNSVQSDRSNDIIDTILTMLREKDLKEKFVNEIIKKYGYAKWDKSIILNNGNMLKTVIVPVADTNNQVQLLIFAYQTDKNSAAFKIIDRNTKQSKLPLHGDKDGKIVTQQTLKGLFHVLDQRIKSAVTSNISNNSITNNGVIVEWVCWYYTSYDDFGNFLISNTQCSYKIRFTYDALLSLEPAPVDFPDGATSSPIISPIVDPLDLIYNCDCNCLENDDLEDAMTNFEPKWGQLGNLEQILIEVKKAGISNSAPVSNDINDLTTKNFRQRMNDLQEHFFANRMFVPQNDTFIDAPNSKKVDRYIYTENLGWIDLHHFFYNVYLSETYNSVLASTVTSIGEFTQWISGNVSGYSYEDKPSNEAGIRFFLDYVDKIKNGQITITDAVEEFFKKARAVDPTKSPNYYYIPHIANGFVPKNNSSKGLVGIDLYNAAYSSYCKRSSSSKLEIRKAHEKIPHSSN